MGSEKHSDYETLSGEYASPYTQRNENVYTTPYATESKEQKYENEYDEYGGHYAEYQKHSNCGRQINFETEYAEYECGRSETDSTKMNKKKKKWCIRCSISFLVLFLLGSTIFGIITLAGKPDLFNTIDNSTESFGVTNSTEPVLSSTKITTIITTSTTVITEPTEKPLPNAIELSGTTTENYWKDYQLLGLYNIYGTRNGAPSYKRARNAFILGEIYFWYVSRCGQNEWIVTSKKEFDEDKDCPERWLWKKSEDTDPSKIGHGQPIELRTKWGEAEQFGGKMHTANITVKAFYN